MKETTAIQDLIIWIEEMENSTASLTFSETEFRTLSQFKDKISSKLEKEKKQIIDSYRDGFLSEDIKLSSDYYNQKFN